MVFVSPGGTTKTPGFINIVFVPRGANKKRSLLTLFFVPPGGTKKHMDVLTFVKGLWGCVGIERMKMLGEPVQGHIFATWPVLQCRKDDIVKSL